MTAVLDVDVGRSHLQKQDAYRLPTTVLDVNFRSKVLVGFRASEASSTAALEALEL